MCPQKNKGIQIIPEIVATMFCLQCRQRIHFGLTDFHSMESIPDNTIPDNNSDDNNVVDHENSKREEEDKQKK